VKSFDLDNLLHKLKHYLPAQAPLKDFVHHNTLHAFQSAKFHEALKQASSVFGYKTYLQLKDYRNLFTSGRINEAVLEKKIAEKKGNDKVAVWKEKLLHGSYKEEIKPRIGELRSEWKNHCSINLDKEVHPLLFRIISAYLDQGISLWHFPHSKKGEGLLSAIRNLERNSFKGIFSSARARNLLMRPTCSMEQLLKIVVGDVKLYEHYVFDQQFMHPGWSGMVAKVEEDPHALLDKRNVSLHDFIVLELLLEIDALDRKFGEIWKPLSAFLKHSPPSLFREAKKTELDEVFELWQEAFEWTYYEQVLTGIQYASVTDGGNNQPSFQALFCIDDRECSLRRYIENIDPQSRTYGTPGFFGVEFFFQPEHGKFYTKLCPAPVTPRHLIKEKDSSKELNLGGKFSKPRYGLIGAWFISQTVGFWYAFRLLLNIFFPSQSPIAVSSFNHTDKHASLTIENMSPDDTEDGLQIGFTVPEMAVRVENLLRSIGLVNNFAPLVYVVAHGASSVNNTHYAGYDCGACSGRPGSVNSRVICFMANHLAVREILKANGIDIPSSTQFVPALHDTTRDEMEFYEEEKLTTEHRRLHAANKKVFEEALDYNAKERSRRFVLMNPKQKAAIIHKKVKLRAVSLFEPRPELNHATNALCIVGRRELSNHLFLDRRSFMNSFDYRLDPEGKYLFQILKAVAPVCGGINLEYYFSRVDNYRLGAGTKLPHNVMGLIGVANGMDGDLRTGLPSQMIEVHDPIRLMVIVEHYPDVVLRAIQTDSTTYEWFENEWVHLVAVHPQTRQFFRFKDGVFEPYNTLPLSLQKVSDIQTLVESSEENFPVYLLN
jgi:hypothetical protein